jgi:hypothetical protein
MGEGCGSLPIGSISGEVGLRLPSLVVPGIGGCGRGLGPHPSKPIE